MHGWQEKLSTSCRVYRLDFCLMATALGAIREECAGKHLNASAHLARNFHRGAKSKTLSPAHKTGTERDCRAMRASHGFLKTSFLPHSTLLLWFPCTTWFRSSRREVRLKGWWDWADFGVRRGRRAAKSKSCLSPSFSKFSSVHTRALVYLSRIALSIHAGKVMDILNSLSHLIWLSKYNHVCIFLKRDAVFEQQLRGTGCGCLWVGQVRDFQLLEWRLFHFHWELFPHRKKKKKRTGKEIAEERT